MYSNFKPADKLASIRQKIKELKRLALILTQSFKAKRSELIDAVGVSRSICDSALLQNALKAREQELRAGMLEGTIGISGAYTNARFVTRTSKRLNRKLLEEELGDITRFLVEIETKYLKLEDLDDDNEWQVIE